MKVVVCGGSDFDDQKKMDWSMDYWLERLGITAIIIGGQVSVDQRERALPWEQRRKWGVDHQAKAWAEKRHIQVIEEKVTDEELKKIGPGAPGIRNRRVLREHRPEYAIGFPGASETTDMLEQARQHGVKRIEVA